MLFWLKEIKKFRLLPHLEPVSGCGHSIPNLNIWQILEGCSQPGILQMQSRAPHSAMLKSSPSSCECTASVVTMHAWPLVRKAFKDGEAERPSCFLNSDYGLKTQTLSLAGNLVFLKEAHSFTPFRNMGAKHPRWSNSGLSVGVWAWVCATCHCPRAEVRGQLFSPFIVWVQGLNSGRQARQQVPLLTEPPCAGPDRPRRCENGVPQGEQIQLRAPSPSLCSVGASPAHCGF